MKNLPFVEKSAEELTKAVNAALKDTKEQSYEEQVEDDAEHGYFQDDED